MSDYTIGIKLGDGSFYSVLEQNFTGKKRFVLSTVKDNQESMQIDFYQSKLAAIEDAEYIGSLVIENIEAQAKGEPEIEVVLGLNPDNTLQAVASNLKSQEKQSLQVSLNNLSADSTYDIPDFELDNNLQATELFDDDSDNMENAAYHEVGGSKDAAIDKPRGNPFFMILFIIGGIIIIGAITLLIWWLVGNSFPGTGDQNNQPINATLIPKEEPTVQITSAPTEAPTEKTIVSESKTAVPSDASSDQKKNADHPLGGYDYSVKRGDTLWDLAQTAYKDPFQWKLIYQANQAKIKDPNLIHIGLEITIPEK